METRRQPVEIGLHLNSATRSDMNAKREITIYDIAKELALSPSTVSRALSSRPSLVRKETIARVQKKAEELGYCQNFFASRLRSQRTQMIAVIVPQLNTLGISNIVSGAETTARQFGYNLVVGQSMNNPDRYNSTIQNFNNNRLEGLLITRTHVHKSKTFHNDTAARIPQIIIEGASLPDGTSTLTNKFDITYELTTDLLQKGCKRIAFVYANQKVKKNCDLLKGYRKALQDSGTKKAVVWGGFDFQGMQLWETILSSPLPPDGIIFSDEVTAAFSIHDHSGDQPVADHPRTMPDRNSALQDNVVFGIPSCDTLILEVGKAATGLLISLIERKFYQ